MLHANVSVALLATILAAACSSAARNPAGPATSHPRTRTEVFQGTLSSGSGIGHDITVPKAGTLVARLRWDNPEIRLSLFLCVQGSRGGCTDDPPWAVGAASDPITQEVVSSIEAGRYLIYVQSPVMASATTSYTLSVSYPLL